MSGSGLSLIAVATLVAGLGALLVIWQNLVAQYRKTIGRRRERAAGLARLGAGAHMSFFEAVLGEPPAIRRTIRKDDCNRFMTDGDPLFDPNLTKPGEPWHTVNETRFFVESIFVDRDYYVQTITDLDGTVLAFSVTTRNRRFRPVYELPPRPGYFERRRLRRKFDYDYEPLLRVVLGRTTFATLDPHPERFAGPHFRVSVGAHNWRYSEFHGFGNPGYYQTVVITASDVAPHAPVGDPMSVQLEVGGAGEWPEPRPDAHTEEARSWDALPNAQKFRRETTITTYTVIFGDLSAGEFPSTFGPQLEIVRTLP